MIEKSEYKLSVSLKKGGYVAGGVFAGILAALEVLGPVTSIKAIPVAVGVAAIAGGLRAAMNWFKQNGQSAK